MEKGEDTRAMAKGKGMGEIGTVKEKEYKGIIIFLFACAKLGTPTSLYLYV